MNLFEDTAQLKQGIMLATELIDKKPFTIEHQGKTWDVTIEVVGINTVYLVKYPGNGVPGSCKSQWVK